MKKISLYMLAALLILINACTPAELPELPEKIVPAKELVGSWKLASVIQSEEKPMGDHKESYDITAAFPFEEMTMEFKEDGTLTINNAGNAPMLFKGGDQYAFLGEDLTENKEKPYFIQIKKGGEETSLLSLNTVGFNTGEMSVIVKGSCESSASYELVFKK